MYTLSTYRTHELYAWERLPVHSKLAMHNIAKPRSDDGQTLKGRAHDGQTLQGRVLHMLHLKISN